MENIAQNIAVAKIMSGAQQLVPSQEIPNL
jgi:hypothetical protein